MVHLVRVARHKLVRDRIPAIIAADGPSGAQPIRSVLKNFDYPSRAVILRRYAGCVSGKILTCEPPGKGCRRDRLRAPGSRPPRVRQAGRTAVAGSGEPGRLGARPAQARLQVASEDDGSIRYEILDPRTGRRRRGPQSGATELMPAERRQKYHYLPV
jgi:hypothetical protein